MHLINFTTKKYLSKDLKFANNFLEKSKGLLSQSSPRSLMFYTRFGIHTFFLKEQIDVLVLDKNYKVKKASTVNPNSIFIYNPQFKIIIELPKGAILKSKTKIGNQLKVLE